MSSEIIPYRTDYETLMAKIEELQKENAKLRRQAESGELIYPWSDLNAECRLCGRYREHLTTYDTYGNKLAKAAVERIPCLTQDWENPYKPNWFKRLFGCKPRMGRMKRVCMFCHGTYYELPKETKQ